MSKTNDETQPEALLADPAEQTPLGPEAPDDEPVRLRLLDPWVHQFNVPTVEGDTLVVTHRPTAFSATDAETVKQAADKHGLHLTEVSE